MTMKTVLKWVFLPVTGLLALVNCSGADLVNLTVPRSGYTVIRDLPYGEHARNTLDIYVPDTHAEKHPVIVFFYGGSWKMGSKDMYRFVGQAFASKGYITVIADYRIYPEVYFPAFMQDAANAFAFVHQHIHTYGGNANHIYVSGHSAGGYIALMLTLNESYMRAAGGNRAWIKGAIGIAGPYDFLPLTDPDIIAIFSKAKAEDTQPIHYVSGHLPPIFLATGDQDKDVLPRNTNNLTQKLLENGSIVEKKTYTGVAHIGIILSLADWFRSKSPLLEDISDFIHRTSTDTSGR